MKHEPPVFFSPWICGYVILIGLYLGRGGIFHYFAESRVRPLGCPTATPSEEVRVLARDGTVLKIIYKR